MSSYIDTKKVILSTKKVIVDTKKVILSTKKVILSTKKVIVRFGDPCFHAYYKSAKIIKIY